jgi:predicted nuclease of restriction endonuclease-like (RecB) superfamily
VKQLGLAEELFIIILHKLNQKIQKNDMNDIYLRFAKEYSTLLNQLKSQIRIRQTRAAISVSRELIELYWHIGKMILDKQAETKWGSKFLEQLSLDLRNEFKEMSGFSKRNLERMRKFATVFPDALIASQAVSQLPWGHIIVLLEKFNTNIVRNWYAEQTLKNGWSRSILLMQIETKLFERQALNTKSTSFKSTLPPNSLI